MPKQKPVNCSSATWNEYQRSRSYLNNLQNEFKSNLNKILNECKSQTNITCQISGKPQARELQETAADIKKQMCCGSPQDKNGCVRAIYPDASYKSCLEKISSSNVNTLSISGAAKATSNCLKNLLTKFIQTFWEGLKGFYKLATELSGALSALKDIITNEQMRTDFVEKMKSAVNDYIFKRSNSAQSCLNEFEQGQLVCSIGGEILGAISDPLLAIKVIKYIRLGGKNLGSILKESLDGAKINEKIDKMNQAVEGAIKASKARASVVKSSLPVFSLGQKAKTYIEKLNKSIASFDSKVNSNINKISKEPSIDINYSTKNKPGIEHKIETPKSNKELEVALPQDIPKPTLKSQKKLDPIINDSLDEVRGGDKIVNSAKGNPKSLPLNESTSASPLEGKSKAPDSKSNHHPVTNSEIVRPSTIKKISLSVKSNLIKQNQYLKNIANKVLDSFKKKIHTKIGDDVIMPWSDGSVGAAKVVNVGNDGKIIVEWIENSSVKRETIENVKIQKASESLSKALSSIAKYDLYPSSQLTLNSGKGIKFSEFFKDSDGRLFTVAEVEENGAFAHRVFYRSNSQAVFRLLTARNKGIGLPGYDKGPGEELLTLAPEIQSHLATMENAAKLDQAKVIPPEKLDGIVRVNQSFEDYSTYKNSNQYPNVLQFKSQKITRDAPQTEYDKVGRNFPKPEQLEISHVGHKPNYQKVINEFQFENNVYGKVHARVYKSTDGALEYTLMQDELGHVWFGDVGTSGSPINEFGLRSYVVDNGNLTMPLWEYTQQIPKHFYNGVHNTANSSYASSWQYIKRIPEIERWYKEMGKPMPK